MNARHSLQEFVVRVSTLLHARSDSVYIVLDKAERLRNLHPSTIPVFAALQELVCMHSRLCRVCHYELVDYC